ncbi:MAG: lysoplasmalogenase family protein [Bacilli bacterium]
MLFDAKMLVALIPFVICMIVHLVFCFREHEQARSITKLTLMPALGFYVLMVDRFASWLFLALLLAYLGDIFLLYKNNKTVFLAGIISFGLSHLTYMYLLLSRIGWNQLPSWPYLVFIPLGLVIANVFLIDLIFKDKAGSLKPVMIIYSFLLTLELAIAIYGATVRFDRFALLLIIGCLLFISSDAYIGITTFLKPASRSHFFIMLTYLLAQVAIVVSLLHYHVIIHY